MYDMVVFFLVLFVSNIVLVCPTMRESESVMKHLALFASSLVLIWSVLIWSVSHKSDLLASFVFGSLFFESGAFTSAMVVF